MRALVALLLAATGCGACTELDPVTALESEYAGRSDLCFTHAALATDETGAPEFGRRHVPDEQSDRSSRG